MDKYGKNNRLLIIFEKLNRGEIVKKKELACLFNVDEKTIQRDLSDIRSYTLLHGDSIGIANIEYVPQKKGYCMLRKGNGYLKNNEILAMTKILIDSRAFCKEEMVDLIDTLLAQASPEQRKQIKEIVGNELLHFVPIKHNKHLLNTLWDISGFIRGRDVIEVNYVKMSGEEIVRNLRPVSIIFSEFYFYLIAYFDSEESEIPIVYRIDRIKQYCQVQKKFNIPEKNRFEAGEFRKRVQFMYPGSLLHIKFEYWGDSIEAVIDRLPTARAIAVEENRYLIEADVFGKGIIMWLLSQGSKIKVLYPDDLVNEVAEEIRKMVGLYV